MAVFDATVLRSASYCVSVVGLLLMPAALKSFSLTVVTSSEASIGMPTSSPLRMNDAACGYCAFTLDIGKYLLSGRNHLVV
jgi:hypothetical protein